jgi:hypothetical protein
MYKCSHSTKADLRFVEVRIARRFLPIAPVTAENQPFVQSDCSVRTAVR